MGNGISLADNQDVEYQSGASRWCNSIIVAICIAPLLLVGSAILLGWNEQRAVCDANAISEGRGKVVQVGCSVPSTIDAGDLVMFSCPLEKTGLPSFTTASGTDFTSVLNYVGTGLRTKAEMFQCVEHESSETQKKSGGGTETIKTYTYSTEWVDHYADSSAFKKKSSSNWMTNCGVENPSWPPGLPTTGAHYAPKAIVGVFTIGQGYVNQVPLQTPVLASRPPASWTLASDQYTTSKWQVAGSSKGIGRARVSFAGNDWANPVLTVLGENSAGEIVPWTASATWLCSGSTLSDLRSGIVSKDDLFNTKAKESATSTWILRVIGFLLAWFALSRIAAPLGVVADCIPCIGPWLGDQVEAIACCMSCFPACACSLGVIGVVWVAMRPMVGIPLIAIFLCTCCGGIFFKLRSNQQRQSGNFGYQARSSFV
mmetsp:Transcript_163598/g.524561  ORF Transcript_163598/g.524561 Transcript_163598/m.524561 type:complete len:428 (+) Transcript_163598:95-1378(+)